MILDVELDDVRIRSGVVAGVSGVESGVGKSTVAALIFIGF